MSLTVTIPTVEEVTATTLAIAATNTALDITNTTLSVLASRIDVLSTRVMKLETTVAGLLPPVVIPPIVPPYDPQVFWRAGMETGNLSEWVNPNNNTGSALSSAVQASTEGIPQLSSPWVMKQQVSVNGAATRCGAVSIVPQVKAGTPFWVTWYDYFPAQIKFGPSDQEMFLQIAGFDGTSYNPVWCFFVDGVNFTPVIIWSPNGKAPASGPHAGETGKRTYATATPVPVGKWTRFELYVDPAADFTGALQLYMDKVLIFDQSAIKTRYPGTGDPGVAGFMYMEHNLYGAPGIHYVDDVTYSLGRMP